MPGRLLILTPCHSLQGGVERILQNLYDGLSQRDFAITFGLARGGRFNDPDRFRRAFPHIPTIDVSSGSGTRQGRLNGLYRALRRVRPDVVLISRLHDAYQAVCELKAAGEQVRLAVTVNALEPEYIADLMDYGSWVDLCMTDARLTATTIAHFCDLPRDCLVSIPGGVAPARTLTRGPTADMPLRLGYVGRLDFEQKRILDLVEVLSLLAARTVPFTCMIAGAGPAEAALRDRVRERHLEGHVMFLGWLSPEQLYETVYPNLDVFLHFSAWEGVTIAPREAMVHGVVPIVSDFLPGRSEGIFRHEETALRFPVGDVDLAARWVCRLHEDRDEWQRLSEAARLSQQGIYSAPGALDAWEHAFRECLSRPPRRGARLPELRSGHAGRLDRVLSPGLAERVRCLLGRSYPHTEPGSEWPHWSGHAPADRLEEIRAYALAREAEVESPRARYPRLFAAS